MLNPTLSDLIGGIQTVTLGDEEARRRRTQKSVLERKAPPTFDVIVEIQDRDRVTVHADVAETVDAMLRGDPIAPELRWRDEAGVHRSQSRPRPSPRTARGGALRGAHRDRLARGGWSPAGAGRRRATAPPACRRATERGIPPGLPARSLRRLAQRRRSRPDGGPCPSGSDRPRQRCAGPPVDRGRGAEPPRSSRARSPTEGRRAGAAPVPSSLGRATRREFQRQREWRDRPAGDRARSGGGRDAARSTPRTSTRSDEALPTASTRRGPTTTGAATCTAPSAVALPDAAGPASGSAASAWSRRSASCSCR